MSYEKLRSVTLKGGRLRVCIASSNVRPTQYHTVDYLKEGTDINKNMQKLVEEMLEGDIQPVNSCRFRKVDVAEAVRRLKGLISMHSRRTSFERDLELKISPARSNGMNRLAAEIFGVPYMLGQGLAEAATRDGIRRLKEFDEESGRIYGAEEERLASSGIEVITCAWASDIFKGMDVLINRKEEAILARREDYDNRGRLRNASKAINLGHVQGVSALVSGTLCPYAYYRGASVSRAFEKIREAGIESIDRNMDSHMPAAGRTPQYKRHPQANRNMGRQCHEGNKTAYERNL